MRKRALTHKLFSFLLAFLMVFSEMGSALPVLAQGDDEAGQEAPAADTDAPEESVSGNENAAGETGSDVSANDVPEPDTAPVEHYGVWIGGTEITSENCDNIPNLEGGTGKLEIIKKGSDYYGYFLTLENVTGIKGGYEIDSFGHKALIYTTQMVQLYGNSTLTNNNGPVIWAENDINCSIDIRGGKHTFKCKSSDPAVCAINGFITITGADTELTILNDDKYDGGFCLSAGKELRLENGKVNLSGRAGIGAEKVIFSGGDYTIKCTSTATQPVIAHGSDESDIVLEGMEIVKPEEGKVTSNGKSGSGKLVKITDRDGNSVSEVHVIPTPEKYGVWVGGTEITSFNKDNIPNLEGQDASGTFDPEKRVLDLHNVTGIKGSSDESHKAKILTNEKLSITGDAKIENTAGSVVYAAELKASDNLVLEGNFEFKGKSNSVIYSNANVALTGDDSKISLEAENTYCIGTKKGFVSLLGGQFSFKGDGGVLANNGKILLAAYIDAEVNSKYGQHALIATGADGDIVLAEYHAILSPVRSEIRRFNAGESTEKVVVIDPNSGDELTKLRIGRKPTGYGLWVGDVEINSANKDDIPNLKGGKGTYNPNTHTLTLNGVTDITFRHNNAMISTDTAEPLTIEGSSNLSNQEGSVIYTNGNITLKGDHYFYSGAGNTIDANTNSITVDGKLTTWCAASGHYGLYTYGGAANVTFKSGRTYLNGKGGVFAAGNIVFEGGELNTDVTENAFRLGKDSDIKFAEGYGIIEPEGASVGTDPDSVHSKTVLNADGSRANKVRLGHKSDIGLYIDFDTADTTLTKNAEGKYTAVYTGASIKPEVLVKNNGRALIEGVDYKLSYSKNKKAGTAAVTVTGIGTYSKKRVLNFDIIPKDLADYDVVIGNLSYQKGKQPAPTVAYYGSILKAGKDYDTEINADKLTIKGKGNFTGSVTLTITEQDADSYKAAAIKVNFKYENMAYNGFKHVPSSLDLDITSQDGHSLILGTDYDVSYSDNVNAGIVKFVVVAKGSRNGIYKKTYKILPDKYSTISVSGLKDSYSYSKLGVKPSIEVKADSLVLKPGRDYSLTYKSNKKLGTASISLKFRGNYKGATYAGVKTFKIDVSNPDPSNVTVIVGDMVYKKPGKYKPAVWAILYGRLIPKSELKIDYIDKDKLTEAKNGLKLTAEGTTNYNFSKWATYNVLPAGSAAEVNNAKVKLIQGGKTVKKVAYTGKEITFSSGNADAPQLSVNINGTVLTGAEVEANFDIYYADNIEKGKATIILKAKAGSGYAGACTGKFTISAMSFEK